MFKFFTFNFWLNIRPGSMDPATQTYYIIFLGVLVVLIFVFGLLKARKNNLYFRVWRKLYSLSLTSLIVGILLLFFTYELIPFLSARFWFLVWAAGILVWLFFVVRDFWEIPKIRQKREKEKEFNKYIP